ncbi:hypothetical protein GGS20DRAFT_538195 [Poronia punctata]|nr:hypothetical protein GGS20DRAFT_538195 [Poronia punctata]
MYQYTSTQSTIPSQQTAATMSSDPSWEPEYCLYCDRQTDGALYCSESCRLRDFESSSGPINTMNSTALPSSSAWSGSKSQTKFYLSPAYDFTNPQPYGSTPLPESSLAQQSGASTSVLTPSSSHSSLCSLGSTASSASSSSSGNETTRISSKTKKHLRDYASSFEHARTQQRRRSC